MKNHFFILTLLSLLMLAGCKDKNNITNEPPQPEPVITEISPERGKSGTEVTITGANFGATPGENAVTFNGTEAVVTGAGETELTVEVPPESGSGPVAVTVAGQTATGPEFTWFPDNTRFVDGVNGNDQGGDNTCGDVGFPCRTISHAIDVAFGGDILEIADAVYTESFAIDKPLTLRGESEAGTIIQAHEQAGMASDRVIRIENVPEFVISDMTIRHGVTSDGGGVFLENASGAFTSVTFEGNTAEFRGGGMFLDQSSLTLTNVTFSGNMADLGGGMLLLGSPTLTNVTFSGNSARDGGGMFAFGGSSPVLVDVTFEGNMATGSGGGMLLNEGSPTLTNVTFSGNGADRGGGMFLLASSPTLTNVTFEGNMAAAKGGGMHILLGDATLSNVVFLSNRAESLGGGMFVENSSPTLTNALFLGNESSDGAGGGLVCTGNCTTSLMNVTIRSNNAENGNGGGLLVEGDSELTLRNTIVWGNFADNLGNEIYTDASSLTKLFYSLYDNESSLDIGGQGAFTTENSLTEGPLFIDPENGDLRLQEGSPAVDAGDPDTDLSIFATDESGNPVDLDGNLRVAGERIDMGAYEHQEN